MICQWENCNEQGQKITVPPGGHYKNGYIYYKKYCKKHFVEYMSTRHHYRLPHFGNKYIDCQGYVKVVMDNGTFAEHRLVMEKKIGRPLKKGESVHHIDGNRSNNNPDNLELWILPPRYGQRASDFICPHCGKPYF